MEQYIPKTAVLAEIENLLDKGKYHEEYDCAYRDGNNGALYALKGKLDAIEVKEMQEESVSEDLEEACEQLAENARKHKAETSSPFFSPTDYKQGVIDGAKWQKEHPWNWKPSEEQIEALEHSLGDYNIKIFEDRYEILKLLYNDLKKLKEE